MIAIRSNAFLKKVIVVAGGTAAGQLIAAASSPILSRLYTPDDFGVLAVYASILSAMAAISSLRFEIAIPIPEKDEDAIRLLALALCCIVFMTFASSIGLYIFSDPLLAWLNAEKLRSYLWLLPVGIFFSGLYQILSFWCIRKEEFGAVARTKIAQSLSSIIVQVLIGLTKAGSIGLIIGQIIGLSSGIGVFIKSLKKNSSFFRGLKYRDLLEVGRKYSSFAKYEAPQILINVIGQNIPQIMLATSFGLALSGFYLMAQKILGYPIALIGNSFRQVYYQKAVVASRDGQLYELTLKSTKSLTLLILLPWLLTIIIAPDFFSLVFGDDWRKAGEYARYIATWSVMGIINIPANTVISIMGIQRFYLVFEVIYIAARIAVAVAAVAIGHDDFAVMAIAWLGVAFNMVLIFGVLHIVKRHKVK